MDPNRLFIERCQQVHLLLESHREIDLLDLSGLLRQLLFDQHSLVDTVNTFKLNLVFHTGTFRQAPDHYTALLSLDDGIDPNTRPPRSPSADLCLGEFLDHVVIYAHGNVLTVKDVIRHAANVAGGIHYDPRSPLKHPEPQLLRMLSEGWGLGGLPLGIRMLSAIARVTMRALAPLVEEVEKRC